MDTINVIKKDLRILLDCFSNFIEEDRSMCDQCKWCGERYGNAELMVKRGEKLTHDKDCPYLVAQDLSTGL